MFPETRSLRHLAVLILLPFVAACASDDYEYDYSEDDADFDAYVNTEPRPSAGERAVQPAPSPDEATAAEPEPSGTRVDLGSSASAGLDDFLGKESMLLGDVVEINMSRKPFLARTTMSVPPDTVRKTESVDGQKGLLTIVLENTSSFTTVETALPKVHLDGTFQIIGTKKIVLHYWTKQSPERPVHFRAVASGGKFEAVYQGSASKQPVRGPEVVVTAEVRRAGDQYRFTQRADALK